MAMSEGAKDALADNVIEITEVGPEQEQVKQEDSETKARAEQPQP